MKASATDAKYTFGGGANFYCGVWRTPAELAHTMRNRRRKPKRMFVNIIRRVNDSRHLTKILSFARGGKKAGSRDSVRGKSAKSRALSFCPASA